MTEKNDIIVLYCKECNKLFRIRKDKYNGWCPLAEKGNPHMLSTRMCVRCWHTWTPRKARAEVSDDLDVRFSPVPLNKYCPECKSPYWNKERVRDV